MTNKFKYVEVAWKDAHSVAEWRGLAELPAPAECVTRGWLVRETDKYVVLAGTLLWKEDGGNVELAGEIIAIPKGGFVTKMRRLKV